MKLFCHPMEVSRGRWCPRLIPAAPEHSGVRSAFAGADLKNIFPPSNSTSSRPAVCTGETGGIVQRPLVEPLHPAQDKFLPGLQGGLLHGGPTLAVLIEPAEIGASG